MAILEALIALIARSAGRILNTVFAWATTAIFGKVPHRKQIYLSIIAFSSILWIFAALGIIMPRFGAWMLTLVHIPDWMDATWVRLLMLLAALLIPVANGELAIRLTGPSKRPANWEQRAGMWAKGYAATVGLSLTLLFTLIIVPAMKLQDAFRRWASAHVPIVVAPKHYLSVLGALQDALERSGIRTRRRPASWTMLLPSRILVVFGGDAWQQLVATQLSQLRSRELEVLLHPSDLVIRGKPAMVSRVQAILTEQLAFTRAYMTWHEDAQAVEDRLRELWGWFQDEDASDEDALRELSRIEEQLRQSKLPFEQWEVLFRKWLMVECAALRSLHVRAPAPR